MMGEEQEAIVVKAMKNLRRLGVETHQIPRGNIRHLRGCLWCIDLEHLENINSLTISSQRKLGESEPLYKFDYAIRGNIRGIPPDRVILHTKSYFSGLFKRKFSSIRWMIPEESDYTGYKINGESPKPGEIWDEGPHRVLVNLLNNDHLLMEGLMTQVEELDSITRFSIFSDKWDESIRLTCNAWLEEETALKVYTSELYIDVCKRVFGRIHAIRRRFGGLTF
jgi:hypothetical protein